MTTEPLTLRDASPAPSPQPRVSPALLSATAAVIFPMTAAVHGIFEKQRDIDVQSRRQQHELMLQREKYVHEARTAYLAQMHDPAQQARVLRLVVVTTLDPAVRSWAQDELHRLAAEGEARENRQRALDAAAERAWDEALAAAGDPRQRAAIRADMAKWRSEFAERQRRAPAEAPEVVDHSLQ
jgi:hypothetical protein